MSHVEVYAKIKVAVISTGDELKKPWEKASEDEIYRCECFLTHSPFERAGV